MDRTLSNSVQPRISCAGVCRRAVRPVQFRAVAAVASRQRSDFPSIQVSRPAVRASSSTRLARWPAAMRPTSRNARNSAGFALAMRTASAELAGPACARRCAPHSPCRDRRRRGGRLRRRSVALDRDRPAIEHEVLDLERRRWAWRRDTSMKRSWRLARSASFMTSGCTWWPSTMRPHQLASCASAAPTAPGSRVPSGDMALNRCVKPRRPAAKAGCSSSKVALVWPAETMTPASLQLRG